MILMVSISATWAQSISPEVVASAGGHFQNGSVQLSWTLGEVMIDTYSSSGNIITQGFHQTDLTVTSVEQTNAVSLDVNVFPNPTAQDLNVDVRGDHVPLAITLYDLNGKLIMQENLTANQNSLSMNVSYLAMANYLLTITDERGSYSATYRVVKSGDK